VIRLRNLYLARFLKLKFGRYEYTDVLMGGIGMRTFGPWTKVDVWKLMARHSLIRVEIVDVI